MPEPIRLDPARPPLAASMTVMEAVATCHGTMTPERFHAWLEAAQRDGWRRVMLQGLIAVSER